MVVVLARRATAFAAAWRHLLQSDGGNAMLKLSAMAGSLAAGGSLMVGMNQAEAQPDPNAERVLAWQKRWDTYIEKNITPGFHRPTPHEMLVKHAGSLLSKSGSEKEQVFVPLCGKSLDMIFLSEVADVGGVECVQEAIDQFSQENGLQYDDELVAKSGGTVFKTAATRSGNSIVIGKLDFFDLAKGWSTLPKPKFSAGYDRAANVAIDPALREAYAKVMAEQIELGGRVLLIAFEYDQSKMSGPPFSLGEKEIRALYAPYFDISILERYSILDDSWRSRGIEGIEETVYLLTRRDE